MWIPAQSKPFALVSNELRLRSYNTLGDTAMLRAVEDENSSTRGHGSNNIWVLWLISRLVDLSWVINLLLNVHFDRSLVSV